jgi:DNA polymerase elongation subunit (family B)
MKHLEETPWFVCDGGDINFCAYIDTDSNYFNAEPLLKYLYPDFESLDDSEKDEILEDIALKYQNIITNHYDILAKECFNVPDKIGDLEHKHRLEMKTEAVIRSAYFRATRRYAQWITKKEGIKIDELDIKGLEFMKANFPPILGKFFNSILQQVLKGAQHKDILDQIKIFKKQILSGEISINKLGNPTSVKKLEKYTMGNSRAGEVFTKIASGAPAPVRAAIRYNDLLKLWKLDKTHNLITLSDKVKWIYLKDNPYKIEALAFLDYDMPDKIKQFLNTYADTQQVFDSILLNKLEGFFSDLGWSLDLNPHISLLSSFEI